MNILITGANGFIGRALCRRLASDNNVIGVDKVSTAFPENFVYEQADLIDLNSVDAICEKYSPNIVIHCAGIAHQKIGAVDLATYLRVNSEATENLAKTASKSNPGVHFIFLSSVSVYGEGPGITSRKGAPVRSSRPTGQAKAQKRKNDDRVGENGECQPSSDYAFSKLDAERRLKALYDKGTIKNLIILRLAPVYDREWSFNLNKRVFAPKKMAYLKFGSGQQRMSALARPNLVDFIDFLIRRLPQYDLPDLPQYHLPELRDRRGRRRFSQIKDKPTQKNNLHNQRNRCNLRINVCDVEPYEFNQIVKVFKQSGVHPNRPVIPIPLSFVWLLTRIAGFLLPNKKKWIHSCYDKLASDLVFDNGKMMGTGFKPRHSLETIFDPQISQINAD